MEYGVGRYCLQKLVGDFLLVKLCPLVKKLYENKSTDESTRKRNLLEVEWDYNLLKVKNIK
jgi:hypothetical protein